ncbi:DUF2809 domain-containing protein [Flavobacterium zepuense]|uniref:DUF2809 domain-containing protein n=1 Tax=Flavobacterium zepuense TaxID=2593302 RepID=A0A552V5H0_9FLAO|nr:DUF2809 domain-containing protein [Flavobacterium zepuense]TRW25691.1 DUF2809 domain-containing protein [Flavobacterium zepuense]
MKQRLIYLVIALLTIITGLLARHRQDLFPDMVNLYLGDVLYAFMMYYFYSFLLPHTKSLHRAVIALVTCYAIEAFQLYEAPWATALRATLFGRLVLGSGFLWSDLLAYFIGIVLAFWPDRFWLAKDGAVA